MCCRDADRDKERAEKATAEASEWAAAHPDAPASENPVYKNGLLPPPSGQITTPLASGSDEQPAKDLSSNIGS